MAFNPETGALRKKAGPQEAANDSSPEAVERPELRTALLNQMGSYPLEKVQGLFTPEEIKLELNAMIFSDLADRAIQIADKLGDAETAMEASKVILINGDYGEPANALAEKYKKGAQTSSETAPVEGGPKPPETRENVGSEMIALSGEIKGLPLPLKYEMFRRLVEGPNALPMGPFPQEVAPQVEAILENAKRLEDKYGRAQVLEVAELLGMKRRLEELAEEKKKEEERAKAKETGATTT